MELLLVVLLILLSVIAGIVLISAVRREPSVDVEGWHHKLRTLRETVRSEDADGQPAADENLIIDVSDRNVRVVHDEDPLRSGGAAETPGDPGHTDAAEPGSDERAVGGTVVTGSTEESPPADAAGRSNHADRGSRQEQQAQQEQQIHDQSKQSKQQGKPKNRPRTRKAAGSGRSRPARSTPSQKRSGAGSAPRDPSARRTDSTREVKEARDARDGRESRNSTDTGTTPS